MTASIEIGELRFRRDVEQLHRLGPRTLVAFLDELGAERLLRSEIEHKLRRYGRVSPDMLSAVGADRLPPSPVWLVHRR